MSSDLDDGWALDDYDEPEGYEPDDDDYRDDDEPEPSEPDWDMEEHYRYQALSRFGRLRYDLHRWWWRRTWFLRWRLDPRRWLSLLTGRSETYSDEPPF